VETGTQSHESDDMTDRNAGGYDPSSVFGRPLLLPLIKSGRAPWVPCARQRRERVRWIGWSS